MNRFDRILGILLLLRSGESVSGAQLAQRFEVSLRTIYRDVEALSALGVPVYAERGREGGFRLLEGYFLPPLMFSTEEAISLLLALTFLKGLETKPFAAQLETAEKKLLAAVSDRLRTTLTKAQTFLGFERPTSDTFHPEPDQPETAATALPTTTDATESQALDHYLQAILDRTAVRLDYFSPYHGQKSTFTAWPLAIFWDRGRWYLVGRRSDQAESVRLWRADRVRGIKPTGAVDRQPLTFDVQTVLGHNWLNEAMVQWAEQAPVIIRLTSPQAERLQRDWYYRHARYEATTDGRVLMTFGEGNRGFVMELLRWLGPGAELLEPAAWRAEFRDELQRMLACYPVETKH